MKLGVRFKMNPTQSDLLKEFEDRWVPEPNSGCWLWTGNYLKKRGGYGVFTMRPFGMQMVRAHRLSWELHRGQITSDQHVLHRCDNPICVNPDHLFLGDQPSNMQDCKEKKRHTYGEKNHWAKLTEDDVLAIRSDNRLQREIASDYGITGSTVGDIKKRRSWRHLGENRL